MTKKLTIVPRYALGTQDFLVYNLCVSDTRRTRLSPIRRRSAGQSLLFRLSRSGRHPEVRTCRMPSINCHQQRTTV